jgi:hypothetical protein
MRFGSKGQIKTCKGGDENQEIHFWFGQRPVRKYGRKEAARALSLCDWCYVQQVDLRLSRHV